MQLFPHNQQAVDKVLEAFKTKSRVAVRHATGTGKSYIIAAVAEHFDSVCVIAPNHFTLSEIRKVSKPGLVTITYSHIARGYVHPCKYDLIVFDEFHHTGAENWGLAAKRLILDNPNAKILGTSATMIRYLDEQRNMADEMFDGNVVSNISLIDAIEQGILPRPAYVTALYELDKYKKKYTNKIDNMAAPEEMKEAQRKRLSDVSKVWESAYGVGPVLRRNLPKNTKRIIAFCQNIKTTSRLEDMLRKWFSSAINKPVSFYHINSKNKEYEREMQNFESDTYQSNTIKIAISVDMLNEGVHVPNVDVVIMLRATASRIIVEQQIGRCLTANKKTEPVVFDLVNNYDLIDVASLNFSAGISNPFNEKRDPAVSVKESGDVIYSAFRVVDECKDVVSVFREIDKAVSSKNDMLFEELKKFHSTYGRLPRNSETATAKEIILFAFLHRVVHLHTTTKEQLDWLNSVGIGVNTKVILPTDELISEFKSCVDEYKSTGNNATSRMNNVSRLLSKKYKDGKMCEEDMRRYESIIDDYKEEMMRRPYDRLLRIINELGRLPLPCEPGHQQLRIAKKNIEFVKNRFPYLYDKMVKFDAFHYKRIGKLSKNELEKEKEWLVDYVSKNKSLPTGDKLKMATKLRTIERDWYNAFVVPELRTPQHGIDYLVGYYTTFGCLPSDPKSIAYIHSLRGKFKNGKLSKKMQETVIRIGIVTPDDQPKITNL